MPHRRKFFRKIPASMKIKLALSPPCQKKATPKTRNLTGMEVLQQKKQKIPGTHTIGAARIAGGKIAQKAADVWKTDVWDFQAFSQTFFELRFSLGNKGKTSKNLNSQTWLGTPRRPSPRHPRPSEFRKSQKTRQSTVQEVNGGQSWLSSPLHGTKTL